MTADGQFFIDGKPYKLERSPEKASTLLRLAGASPNGVILVSEDGREHGNPDELIEIAPGDQFWTKKRDDSQKPVGKPVRYSVNGEERITAENPLSLESILQSAGAGAAIDVSDLQSYYLENTADGRKYENLNDLVTISDGDNFVAIHVGSTPVACIPLLERIAEELRGIGLEPRVVDFPDFWNSGRAVVFEVDVQHGRYKGETLAVALSFQEDAYPEYPPHFVHLKSSIRTVIRRHSLHDFEGESWSAYSLPPSDFWDRLESSKKNMRTYYRRHLLRLLAQL